MSTLRRIGRRGRRRWWAAAGAVALVLIAALALTGALHRSATVVPAGALPLEGRWEPTTLRGQITSLLLAPRQPSVVLAASTNGVWRSTNSGATWQQDGTGMQGRAMFVLADTATSSAVWAGSFDGAVYLRGSASGTHVTWRRISPVLLTDPSLGAVAVYSLAVSPLQGHPILAGSLGAIFRAEPSADGRTWRWERVWRRQGSANANLGSGAITSLLIAPWDPRLVFASVFGAAASIMVSHDGGHTWAAVAPGLPSHLPVQDLAAGDARTHQIFLTTMGGGVWQRSADGQWRDISAGLPQHHAMPLLAAAPASAGVLYAGTMSVGVYEKQRSSTWQPLGHGLSGPAATVMGLAQITGPHAVLLAGTTEGVFRYAPYG